ncbi:DUF1294 domain-containing protein [Bacillus altitudinis MN12]|uniref:DUF1294 domain-containing protein n=1 Tax=Bacillus altitudinis TaxID=293387 RepID=UPI000706C562|nr:DUF1294 domain-containing protein [Bacillus altitudinis]ALM28380.1 hypothetical protein AKO65_10330 [Bacillus altitudinis]ALM44919.1 hypothetical protein AMR71_06640 [Bacillus altitudinis]ANY96398.1 hypothetical protein AKO66_06645 [Bacillus altitudinis]MBR0582572.1 DUF1294 domain-containing protein [Bacillus altitudinis MN12]MBR0593251.1 DUF1294 domain-containing protein [Bacillus altitudinis C16B11]
MNIALIVLLILVNVYGFCLMGEDKRRAKAHKWRISEAHLWSIAVLFGAAGSFLGMQYFRHKTKHPAFQMGMPALIVVQLVILGYINLI